LLNFQLTCGLSDVLASELLFFYILGSFAQSLVLGQEERGGRCLYWCD